MFFKDTSILMIGGTGEIGQTIFRELLTEQPKLIRIMSRDEYKQHVMQMDLRKWTNVEFVIGDIRNPDSVSKAMKNIDYVFHLAAMKHVSFCEQNPYEAVMTNVQGTSNVIQAARINQVKKVVFTSSDKAIYPTNTYGATKLIAERMMISANDLEGPIFSCVRFGNVLGSRGSVIPLFKRQILNDSMVTVTDDNMSRFMMTKNQASKLTIKALQEAQGGETYVLKMPVIILKDLVQVVVEETCKKYDHDLTHVKIVHIGMKIGEKMYEELMTADESKQAYDLGDMYVIINDSRILPDLYSTAKVNPGHYRSVDQEPITKEEIKRLIMSENLI